MTINSTNAQTKVYQVLTGANIAAGRVYDHAPQDVVFPFVEIGESVETEDDNAASQGVEHVLTLHVWSRYRGQKEIKDIVAAIRGALHQQSLTVTGLASCNSYVDGVTHLIEDDGLTRHAAVRVRLHLRE